MKKWILLTIILLTTLLFSSCATLNPESLEEGSRDSGLGDYPIRGETKIKEKLLLALGKFYDGDFEAVIKLCKEVLEVEPDNTTALKRLGSAYYKLKCFKDANFYWKKAYRLDPDDVKLKKFIDKTDKILEEKGDNGL